MQQFTKRRTPWACYGFCNGLEQNAWVINVSDDDPKNFFVTGHGSRINSDTDIPTGSPTWMTFKVCKAYANFDKVIVLYFILYEKLCGLFCPLECS